MLLPRLEKALRRLRDLVEELRATDRTAQALGLNKTSLAIYDVILQRGEGHGRGALERRSSYTTVDEPTRELAALIGEQLEELAVVDWIQKDDIQREMRRRIKRQLRAAGIEPDRSEALATAILDIARSNIRR